jgi:hypothetical protein
MRILSRYLWQLTAAVVALVVPVISEAQSFDQFRDFRVGPNSEVVMRPGNTIVAHTKFGEISITALSSVERQYVVRGQKREQKLSVMDKRSHGVKGINSTNYFSDYMPGLEGGQMTISGMEGQVNFTSESDLHAWLDRFWGSYAAFNSRGIIVGWYYTSQPNSSLVVQVFEACIKGKHPMRLVGASDSSVVVTGPDRRTHCADALVTQSDIAWPR